MHTSTNGDIDFERGALLAKLILCARRRQHETVTKSREVFRSSAASSWEETYLAFNYQNQLVEGESRAPKELTP